METRKQWTIRKKYIVTERPHETDINDFAIDTISGRMLGILFPFSSAQEQRIYADLESGIINIDQPCMEWLSSSEKALYRKLEDQKASVNANRSRSGTITTISTMRRIRLAVMWSHMTLAMIRFRFRR